MMNGVYSYPERASFSKHGFAPFHDDSPDAYMINTQRMLLTINNFAIGFTIEKNILKAQRQLQEIMRSPKLNVAQSVAVYTQNVVYTEMLKKDSGLGLGSQAVKDDDETLMAFRQLLHETTARVKPKVSAKRQSYISTYVQKIFAQPEMA